MLHIILLDVSGICFATVWTGGLDAACGLNVAFSNRPMQGRLSKPVFLGCRLFEVIQ